MNIAVSIKNATAMTPTLTAVAVQNADWVTFQELKVGQSIAAGKTVAGLLDANLPFTGSIRVEYGFISPGPGGADIDFILDGKLLDGSPLIGCGVQARPATALPGTSWDVHREGNDYFLMLTVQP
jgi:hypothetical protein